MKLWRALNRWMQKHYRNPYDSGCQCDRCLFGMGT